MAIIEVNFISKCLMRVVTFNAIIPVDKFGPQAENSRINPVITDAISDSRPDAEFM